MSIERNKNHLSLSIPLIDQEQIIRKYNIDFYGYIENLLKFRTLLTKNIIKVQKIKKQLLNQMAFGKKVWFYLGFKFSKSIHLKTQSKINDSHLANLEFTIQLLRDLLKLIWVTPLFTHTIHKPTEKELKFAKGLVEQEQTIDSIFHLYISYYEEKKGFNFEVGPVNECINSLRDEMAKMWLYFKERQLNVAMRKLNEISRITNKENHIEIISNYVDELIPIFSIYEILHRPLAESIYPEASPQSKRFGAYIARFLSSRFNPLGVNLMKLFNKLAYNNWSFLISQKRFKLNEFFRFILKLPIWKHIPDDLRKEILSYEN